MAGFNLSSLVVKSYAKVNLYLNVLNKRKDGYHNIETVFERISLCDKIILKSRPDNEIKISCRGLPVPQDNSNLAFKSAQLLQKSLNLNKGVDIKIIKRIPVGSGLGGGSSNAASALLGLNKLWKLGLSENKLAAYARKIGADAPFFICNKTFVKGTGRGDILEPLDIPKTKFWHILVVPKIKVSTPYIYEKWDIMDKIHRLTIQKYDVNILSLALKKNAPFLMGKNIFNALEFVTTKIYPEINRIKEKLDSFGVKVNLMSGSGPAVFGFVSSRKEASGILGELKKNRFWQVFLTHTV